MRKGRQKGAKDRKSAARVESRRAHGAPIPAKLRGHGKKGAGLKRPAWMLTK